MLAQTGLFEAQDNAAFLLDAGTGSAAGEDSESVLGGYLPTSAPDAGETMAGVTQGDAPADSQEGDGAEEHHVAEIASGGGSGSVVVLGGVGREDAAASPEAMAQWRQGASHWLSSVASLEVWFACHKQTQLQSARSPAHVRAPEVWALHSTSRRLPL